MAKKRTATGKNGDAVLKEYNHRCAICGTDRPQIHHIDEDPSNQDKLNLLPLCPNCHLSDQHNPTARLDARLLRLFRVYKDPTILCAQFVPLFRRLIFMDEPEGYGMDGLADCVTELVGFLSQLEMGPFYAEQVKALLKAPVCFDVFYPNGETESQRIEREQRRRTELLEYATQIREARRKVHELAVEAIRYQPWRRG